MVMGIRDTESVRVRKKLSLISYTNYCLDNPRAQNNNGLDLSQSISNPIHYMTKQIGLIYVLYIFSGGGGSLANL